MVSVKILKYDDVPEMKLWGKHADIRLKSYDFPYDNQEDCEYWFYSKVEFLRKKIFGIYADGEIVGYITFKNINWILRKAELGIALNPDLVGNGIGKEALKKYLEIVFTKYKMKRMSLRVANFNVRAQSAYFSVGFKKYKEKIELYEEQEFLLENDNYKKYEDLKFKNGKIYSKYIYMTIKRNDFKKHSLIVDRVNTI